MPNAPGDGLPRHRRSDDNLRRWVLPGAALGEVPEKPSTEEAELPLHREVWLNAPSTAARLLGALERYEYINNKIMGEFE